jgi:hypothetical protein
MKVIHLLLRGVVPSLSRGGGLSVCVVADFPPLSEKEVAAIRANKESLLEELRNPERLREAILAGLGAGLVEEWEARCAALSDGPPRCGVELEAWALVLGVGRTMRVEVP